MGTIVGAYMLLHWFKEIFTNHREHNETMSMGIFQMVSVPCC